MELTLDQALQKGVEAHKAGKAQEADQYYTAILKADPKHPDANHNMGVLAVGVGKVEEALPFFKTALEVNPSIPQYWLSYIDALIRLDRVDEARAVLDQAKQHGVEQSALVQIEERLGSSSSQNSDTQDPPNDQLQSIVNLYTKGQLQEALDTGSQLLKQFPTSVLLYNIIGAANQELGNLTEAIKAYSKAISIKPDLAEAYNNMGVALKDQGKSEEANEAFTKALSIKPDYAEAYNNMGNTLQDQGKLDEATEAYNKAISIKPDYADAYNNMGNVLKDQAKLEDAIEALTKATSIKPDFSEAYNNMSLALKDQGKLDDAIEALNKALAIKPDYADAYNNMGIVFQEQDELEEAIKAYNKALAIKPDNADAYNNMGNALKEQEKLDDAIEAYNKALSIKPDYAEVYNNMGNAFQDQGKLEEAIKAYNKALSIKPDYAEAYNNMGATLQDQGKLDEAIKAYNKALAIKPDYAEAYNNMGNALKEQGKLDDAIEAYDKALSIKPDYPEAHHNLSSIKKYTEDDKHFLQVQEFYKQENLSENDKCHFSFALAKMYEDIGKLHQSYAHLSEGNALRKKLLKYSINQDKVLFTKLKETQPNVQKSSLEIKQDSIEATPIFILGMPRSGTTLVEQIISSHSDVLGAGELNHVSQLGLNLSVDPKAIDTAAISKFRKMYLSELSKVADGKPFVTDKMPENFRFIPLICAAFPEAKIIHVERNPVATCWSNYKQYFSSKGLGYCCDLRDLVTFYGLYKELMKLWNSEYDDRIYNLNYEELTTDQENQTRKLITHLNLPWENACLSPHKNKRSVRTASQQQVRQEVYKGSSEAWRKYEPYLNGAFDIL